MRRRELVWRNLRLALRRAPRDKRALQLVLSWFGLFAYAIYFAGMAHYYKVWGVLGIAGILALAGVVAVLMAKANARAGDTLLKLSTRSGPAEDDLREHRKRIVAVLLRTAALSDRAAVESLAQQGRIVEAQRGVGRQRALALSRLEMIAAGLSDRERELLIADEGSWKWEEVWPWIVQAEDVRVMRWVLRMDEVLRPFEFLEPDLSPVFRTTTHAEETNGDGCLASYDLRPAEAMAQTMVARCLAEGVQRGFYSEDDPALRVMYLDMAERMALLEDEDLLLGTVTVAKADQKQIEWVAQAALRRVKVLEGLIAYLNGPAEAELRIQSCGTFAVEEA